MTEIERGRQLIERHLNGNASENELAELERLICRQPRLCEMLAEEAELERGLETYFRRQETSDRPVRAESMPTGGTRSHAAGRRPRVAVAVGALCAAVAAAAAVVFWPRAPGQPGPPSMSGAVTATSTHAPGADPAGGPDDPAMPLLPELPEIQGSVSGGKAKVWEREPPGLVRKSSILLFDFEGRLPGNIAPWRPGIVAECPRHEGGHLCIRGQRMRSRPEQLGATLGDWKKTLFVYSEDLYVRFAYWVGETTTGPPIITLAIHGEAEETFRLVVPVSGRTSWVHVTVPLSHARSWHRPSKGLAPGDGIRAVHFNLPYAQEDVFLLDDVEIARYGR